MLKQLFLISLISVDFRSPENILPDRFGEGIGFLENHPHVATKRDGIGFVNVRITDENSPFDSRSGDEVVHPVDATEKCALPTSRGTDKRGNLIGTNFQGDA